MRLTRNRLSRLRQKAGFDSASKAAAKVGCSTNHLWCIEQGRDDASQALMAAMALAYHVSLDQIRAAYEHDRKNYHRRQLGLD